MMVLHVAKKAASTSDTVAAVLHTTHGRAHSPTHVSAPAHIHTADTIAHCPYHYDAQTLTFVFIHTFAHCTLFLALFVSVFRFAGHRGAYDLVACH